MKIEGLSKYPTQIVMQILDDMDVQVLVTDPTTDAILFANKKMNAAYGVTDDPTGKTCWRVYNKNIEHRCNFCPLDDLVKNPTNTYVWEIKSKLTGKWFRNTDTMIPWGDGKLAHLQQCADITSTKEFEETMNLRLSQQKFLSDMTKSLVENGDIHRLLTQALLMTGQFMNADRVMVGPWDEQRGLGEYRYMWDKHPVEGDDAARIYDMSPGSLAHDAFIKRGESYIAIEDVSAAPDTAFLMAYGVQSILRVPILVSDRVWGLLDIVMDESGQRAWTGNDIYMGRMIASVLGGVVARSLIQQDLVAAKEQAEASNRAKSEFLSRMSHEMRTPMNAIIGMSSIAKNTDDIERMRYCIDKIDGASVHLLGVINDILDMSKIESGRFDLAPSDFLVEEMLGQVSNIVSFRAEQKKQRFTIKVDRDIPPAIVADQQRLSQVITNLLSNAVKFTPESGNISLHIHKVDGDDERVTLRFEVIDDGIGISPEHQKKLFQSFEQGDGSISRRFGGTGLGLAISKQIVSAMGGEIGAKSELGSGSEFFFTVCVDLGSAERDMALSPSIDAGRVRVMVVDDNLETREYFEDIVLTVGLSCKTAASAEEALRLLDADGRYDILFIDWMMPGMDGIELTRVIREKYGAGSLVIMISAAEWTTIEREAIAAGVDRFLPKPLLPSPVIDCINQCLGANGQRERADAGRAGRRLFDGKRVLLAEDVALNREILLALLEDTGVQIDCAEDGQQVYDMFAASPGSYDMIFMDIHMPGVDGYQATRMIRAIGHEWAGQVPIVAMTANVFREDVERCLAAGMNDHIGKPVDAELVVGKMYTYMCGDGAPPS